MPALATFTASFTPPSTDPCPRATFARVFTPSIRRLTLAECSTLVRSMPNPSQTRRVRAISTCAAAIFAMLAKPNESVPVCCGRGSRRSVAATFTPKAPLSPRKMPVRSGPP